QATSVSVAGIYTITIGGSSGSLGIYHMRVIVNAAVEEESHGGPANDELASAQDLGASFIALGGGATPGAVLGPAEPAGDDYAFHVDAGQSVSLALLGLSGNTVSLQLQDALGHTLALGFSGYSNVGQAISNYVATESGTYYAIVSGFGGDYSLLVVRGALF